MRIAPPLKQTFRFRHFSCPECQGALEPLTDTSSGIVTFVCRIGHTYDARELLVGKELFIEQMLWSSLTAIDELIVMMAQAEERGESGSATKDWRNRLE